MQTRIPLGKGALTKNFQMSSNYLKNSRTGSLQNSRKSIQQNCMNNPFINQDSRNRSPNPNLNKNTLQNRLQSEPNKIPTNNLSNFSQPSKNNPLIPHSNPSHFSQNSQQQQPLQSQSFNQRNNLHTTINSSHHNTDNITNTNITKNSLSSNNFNSNNNNISNNVIQIGNTTMNSNNSSQINNLNNNNSLNATNAISYVDNNNINANNSNVNDNNNINSNNCFQSNVPNVACRNGAAFQQMGCNQSVSIQKQDTNSHHALRNTVNIISDLYYRMKEYKDLENNQKKQVNKQIQFYDPFDFQKQQENISQRYSKFQNYQKNPKANVIIRPYQIKYINQQQKLIKFLKNRQKKDILPFQSRISRHSDKKQTTLCDFDQNIANNTQQQLQQRIKVSQFPQPQAFFYKIHYKYQQDLKFQQSIGQNNKYKTWQTFQGKIDILKGSSLQQIIEIIQIKLKKQNNLQFKSTKFTVISASMVFNDSMIQKFIDMASKYIHNKLSTLHSLRKYFKNRQSDKFIGYRYQFQVIDKKINLPSGYTVVSPKNIVGFYSVSGFTLDINQLVIQNQFGRIKWKTINPHEICVKNIDFSEGLVIGAENVTISIEQLSVGHAEVQFFQIPSKLTKLEEKQKDVRDKAIRKKLHKITKSNPAFQFINYDSETNHWTVLISLETKKSCKQ